MSALSIYIFTVEPWLRQLKILILEDIKNTKLVDITRNVLSIQLGIILALVILGYSLYWVVKIKEFRIICWGLLINLIYIFLNIIVIKSPGLLHNPILIIVITGADLLATFCFLYALRQSHKFFLLNTFTRLPIINRIKFFSRIKYVPNPVVLLVFALIGVIKIAPDLLGFTTVLFIYNIPVSFLNFSVIYALAMFFKSLGNEETNTKLLYYATLVYACIQPLSILWIYSSELIGTNVITLIGFSLGLLCKTFMLIGIIVLVKGRMNLIDVLEQKQSEIKRQNEVNELIAKAKLLDRFEDILLGTFHELSLPIISLGASIDELVNPESSTPRAERREQVANDYEKVLATFMDFKQAYDKRNAFLENANIETLPKDVSVYSLNFLIQTAIRFTKSANWKFSYSITADFGGRCTMECSQYEVVLVFVNLFKNALEAYEARDKIEVNQGNKKPERRVICIKTFNSKDNNDVESKTITAEVEDYALGIPPEIIDKIWVRAFTTKELNKQRTSGGSGLTKVKEIFTKNQGWSIDVESPVRKYEGIVQGTKFIMKFPKA